MAAKDDKAKKRKRETIDAVTKTKRQRAEKKGAGTSNAAHANGASEVAMTEDGPRELEATREFGQSGAGWRVSKPMGGRMLDIDPIMTADDRHLILAYNTSVQVYSASDSLLVRRIPIRTPTSSDADDAVSSPPIVSMKLSTQNARFLWVATASGAIYHVDWTRPSKNLAPSFTTATGSALDLVIHQHASSDTLLVLENGPEQTTEVNAYPAVVPTAAATTTTTTTTPSGAAPVKNIFRLPQEPENGLCFLSPSTCREVLVGAVNDRLFVSPLTFADWDSLEPSSVETFSFQTADIVSALDVKVGGDGVVDVVVGGARGALYCYADILSRLLQTSDRLASKANKLQARKLHWHRKAVHSVKWSRDGNYLISGGSENTLVMWQVDTGKADFLPHLSGAVENIVVSDRGSSYAVHLDDNSAMVLSTAELRPTVYVSGLQSATSATSKPKDHLVQRAWSAHETVSRPVPAAISPTNPRRIHVCVGKGQQQTFQGERSAPLLQSFDLESFTAAALQPLARTHPTDVNDTRKGTPLTEPSVPHLAFSTDGRWLASVDEWQPLGGGGDARRAPGETREQLARDRLEVHLKFWQVDEADGALALVSRVNGPHAAAHPERVLALAASPAAPCFATLGGDSRLRFWTPRAQKAGRDTESAVWGCSGTVALGDALSQDVMVEAAGASAMAAPPPHRGCLAFSEDGSTLFAAYGTAENGAVHVVDVASGEVVDSMEGLWKGDLRAVGIASEYLILLSDELRVYDIVGDELRYAIRMPKAPSDARHLPCLAVDHATGHFAISVPTGAASTLGVFDPEDPQPLLVRRTQSRVVSLVSGRAASGFIAVDDAAQIIVVAESSDPTSLSAVQPLDDLRLEEGPVAAEERSQLDLAMGGDGDDDDGDDDAAAGEDGGDAGEAEDVVMGDAAEDAPRPRLVPTHLLSDIFDAAPNYQAASVEDLFYKVIGLTQEGR